MGHQPLQGGMSTDMRGVVVDALAVSFGAAGAPTLVDGGKSGLIASVVQTATGRYTFQLNPNYYKAVVTVLPKLSAVAANGARLDARYIEGSYSNTAGTFEVDTSDATPVAADPTNGTVMSLLIVFQRYTNL